MIDYYYFIDVGCDAPINSAKWDTQRWLPSFASFEAYFESGILTLFLTFFFFCFKFNFKLFNKQENLLRES